MTAIFFGISVYNQEYKNTHGLVEMVQFICLFHQHFEITSDFIRTKNTNFTMHKNEIASQLKIIKYSPQ